MYIAPSGSDTNPGSLSAPYKTFAKAFSVLKGGGELILLDGTYASTTTGCINYMGANDGMPPNGTAAAPTMVRALHPGTVTVKCGLFVGRSSAKASYVVIDGITFDAGTSGPAATVYHTDHVTIRNGGFHSDMNMDGDVFDVGNSDGYPNTNDLFEDVWIWGKARGIADNYTADSNTWRRVLLRGDGCSVTDCNGSGNPNIGITTYNSQHVTMENVIILDRVLAGSGNNYADFATAQHDTGTSVANGDNQWLGDMSINAPDHCAYFESDRTGPQPEATVKDFMCWKPKEVGAFQPTGALVVNGITTTDSAVDLMGSSVTKANVLTGATQTNHAGGGSWLFRYVDRKLTTTQLWPWPNEARIKADLCANTTRGLCATGDSLTRYIWNQLGNGNPY